MTAPTDISSSSSSAIITTTTTSVPQIQIHHLISVKLNNENCLLWLAQFPHLLQGYDLQGYVDGTYPCPARLLPNTTAINPEYTMWKKQDNVLLGWLLSSLSEPVLAQVIGLHTSQSVWEPLQKHFSSKSQSRILYLKRELQSMRKGNQTMAEYYLHAKKLQIS